ncbi:MAG: VapE family protein [Candidatus Methanomethylicaceae archaeon]
MNNTTNTKEMAVQYLRNGFSVIPLMPGTKKPSILWQKYQSLRMTPEEVDQINWEQANIGIVTGSVSSLLVLDADTPDAVSILETIPEMTQTATVQTRRGKHYYLRIQGMPIRCTRIGEIDIKANGGYVVAPPSVVGGVRYTWERDLSSMISITPERLQEILLMLSVLPEYREGQRQNLVMSLAGYAMKNGMSREEVTRLVEHICTVTNDQDLRQRLSAVECTYRKNPDEVIGITGLKQCGVDISVLKASKPEVERKPITIETVMEAIARTGKKLYWDQWSHRVFCECEEDEKPISDEEALLIHATVESMLRRRVPTELFQQAITLLAMQSKRDRLIEFLEDCHTQWDGIPRISRFFVDVFGCPESTQVAATYMFGSAVHRAYYPGCFIKGMLVIIGPQNYRKSQVVRELAPGFTAELCVSASTEKDFFLALRGSWILEVPEMDSFRRADHDRVKAVISTTVDRYRAPYARTVQDYPRRCIFIGTTNHVELHHDPTGGTRYIPVRVVRPGNLEYIQQWRVQLWAEAVERFVYRHEPFWSDDWFHIIEAEQESVRESDPWEQILLPVLAQRGQVTILELATILGIDVSRVDQRTRNRIADILRLSGFMPTTVRMDGTPRWVWVRTDRTER